MSYCRFSSDDWQCDVYVYADVSGGYTTHVASNRPVFTAPLPPIVSFNESPDRWMARHTAIMAMLETAERHNIDHPDAGETFHDATADDCADRLELLRSEGFNVPQYAVDALREEAEAERRRARDGRIAEARPR